MKRSPRPEKQSKKFTRGICRVCGCSEYDPCPEGCAWTSATKTMCTACALKELEKQEEIKLFLCTAKRIGFDPLVKQIHAMCEVCGRDQITKTVEMFGCEECGRLYCDRCSSIQACICVECIK